MFQIKSHPASSAVSHVSGPLPTPQQQKQLPQHKEEEEEICKAWVALHTDKLNNHVGSLDDKHASPG